MEPDESLYMILWEFYIQTGSESRFEQVYGSDGDWVRLFERAKGYIGTELHRDSEDKRRYVTMDFWASQQAYESFRERWSEEYEMLDRTCESLIEREAPLGSFLRLGGSKRPGRHSGRRA